MNTIPLLINLMLFQAPDYTPTPETDLTLVYVAGFLVVIFAVVVILAVVIFLVARKKRSEPPSLFTEAPKRPQPVPPPAVDELATQKRVAGPSPSQKAVTPAIFISYRREDTSDVTGRIYDRLCQHFGKENVFKDVDSIPLGVDFRKHLGNSVGQCNVLLTIIGRQWLAGEKGKRRLDDARDFVRIEMEAALKRDIPVVPVLVQGAEIPAVDDLPELLQSLSYRNGIPVRPDPDFHQDMDRLIKGIEGYLKTGR